MTEWRDGKIEGCRDRRTWRNEGAWGTEEYRDRGMEGRRDLERWRDAWIEG